MAVSLQVAAAFLTSANLDRDLHKRWIQASFQIGSRLPASLLMASIQRLGELDLLLRAMEGERESRSFDETQGVGLLSFNYQVFMSELWVGVAYEAVRLISARELMPKRDDIASLSHDLRLLRIPLEKHEIAVDKRLPANVVLERHPPRGDESDLYVYDKSDSRRAHIMPIGVTDRGSVTWCAVDVLSSGQKWIERRDLSDRFLVLAD